MPGSVCFHCQADNRIIRYLISMINRYHWCDYKCNKVHISQRRIYFHSSTWLLVLLSIRHLDSVPQYVDTLPLTANESLSNACVCDVPNQWAHSNQITSSHSIIIPELTQHVSLTVRGFFQACTSLHTNRHVAIATNIAAINKHGNMSDSSHSYNLYEGWSITLREPTGSNSHVLLVIDCT